MLNVNIILSTSYCVLLIKVIILYFYDQSIIPIQSQTPLLVVQADPFSEGSVKLAKQQCVVAQTK